MQGISLTYKVIIADDNEIDRLSVQMHLKPYPFLTIAAVCSNAEDALAAIEQYQPDVLLLDIDMLGMSGLDLRRLAGNDAACIFITSYPDYAVESFELAALDFIVKPLKHDRFAAAMQRLQLFLETRHKAALFDSSLGTDAIFIKDGHDKIKIQLHDVIYLEALRDYTRIITHHKNYTVLSLLGNLLQEPAFKTFVRIHRSYAVQKHFINKIETQHVLVQNISLPLGRSYKDAVEMMISNN